MAKQYIIFCETEGSPVLTAYLDSEPTECPHGAAHVFKDATVLDDDTLPPSRYLEFSREAVGTLVPAGASFVNLLAGSVSPTRDGWLPTAPFVLKGISLSVNMKDGTRGYQIRVFKRSAEKVDTQIATLDLDADADRLQTRRDLSVSVGSGFELVARMYRSSGSGDSAFSSATLVVEVMYDE